MKEAAGIAVGVVVGAFEVVAVGVLLAIGFHLGAKIIEKVEGQQKLSNSRHAKLAGARV
mgnify:CR=1 FL=1